MARLQEPERAAHDLHRSAGRGLLRESGEVQEDGRTVDAVGTAGDEPLRDVEQRADCLDDVLVERSPGGASGAVVADEPRPQAGPLAGELLAATRALRGCRRAARKLDELLGGDDELDQALRG